MLKTSSLFALSLLAVGCGPYLQYKPMPPAPTPAGKIIVEVRDSREPGKGGTHHERVGMMTGMFGIPSPVEAKSPTEVTDVMAKLIGEAAMSAGIGVAQAGDQSGATARVIVDVQRLWCTGYNPVYKGDVTASLEVTDPAGQQVRIPGQPLHADDGGIDCRRIYRTALTNLFKNAQALVASANVHAAATGANLAPPPPPAN